VPAGNNNEHWFAGRYVLRRYRDRRAVDTVVFEHTILDHLGGLGWPVAVPVAAGDGQRILEVEGRLYAVFPRLPGRRGVPERPREPRKLGRMLARLHRDLATCNYEAPETLFAPLLNVATTWGTGTHTVDELLATYAEGSPEAAAECQRALDEVRAEVAGLDTSGMTRTLIHGDWHAGNILYSSGAVTGVLDFDFAHPDLRVADLAISATVISDDAAVELIEGYQEEQTVEPAELRLLNLCERARLLGAVAATLSIQSRGGRVNTDIDVVVGMLRRVQERWPAMKRRIGLP
jgi:Ser/Thr protein kinase RdoA (MazF antagonist)